MPLKGKVVGDVRVTVYRTSDNKTFFYLKADNEDVLPVLYIIEDSLYLY